MIRQLTKIEMLMRVPPFNQLHPDLFNGNNCQITEIITGTSKGHVPSNALYFEGDVADKLYYVVDGLVVLTRFDEAGKETSLCFCQKGQFFGDDTIAFDERISNAYVVRRSRLLCIAKHFMCFLVNSHAQVTLYFAIMAQRRTKLLSEHIMILADNDSSSRIKRLLELYEQDTEDHKSIFNTHIEIAKMINTTRETVTRTLATGRKQV